MLTTPKNSTLNKRGFPDNFTWCFLSQSYVIAPNYLLIRLFHSNALNLNGSFGFLSHHMMMVFTTQTLHSPWSSEKHRVNDFQATQKDCISKTVRERDRSIIMRCPSIQLIKGKNSILTHSYFFFLFKSSFRNMMDTF